jgi:FkbM family methyltransferase
MSNLLSVTTLSRVQTARPRSPHLLIRNRVDGLTSLFSFDNWPALAFARLFDRRTGCVVYRKGGLEILVDHKGGDASGTRNCIVSEMYRAFLPLLSVPMPARVLDIGANGGGFPLMLKLSGIELRRVVSVEMNPVTYSRLCFNLATNIGRIGYPINAAVSGLPSNSIVNCQLSRGNTGESIFDDVGEDEKPSIAVRTTTITDLCEMHFPDGEPIDICKIDIEGAEYDALATTPDRILGRFGNLFIEFHDPTRTQPVIGRLATLGFTETVIHYSRPVDAQDVRVFKNSRG